MIRTGDALMISTGETLGQQKQAREIVFLTFPLRRESFLTCDSDSDSH